MGLIGTVTVRYQTVPVNHTSVYYPAGVARANDSDYVPIYDGEVTFQPNQTSQTVPMMLREDEIPEADEYVFVQLLSASLVSGGQQRPRMLFLSVSG